MENQEKNTVRRQDNADIDRGRLQVYTGDGKGKTSAAVGLAVRAAGAGRRVFFAQFLKGEPSSEVLSLRQLENKVTTRLYGSPGFIRGCPAEKDKANAQAGLEEVSTILLSGEYRVVILDEINMVLDYGLVPFSSLRRVLIKRSPEVEVILTGRRAPPELLEIADLVTEMRAVKHYYREGVKARLGIEF